MSKRISHYIFLIFLLSTFLIAESPMQEAMRDDPESDYNLNVFDTSWVQKNIDSATVIESKIKKSTLASLRKDSDLNYDWKKEPVDASWWEELLWKIRLWIYNNLISRGLNEYKGLLFIALILVFALILYFVNRSGNKAMIVPDINVVRRKASFSDEDLHEINFEVEIRKTIAENQLRRAVRLYYLFVLKRLTDRSIITWGVDKTNHHYEQEIQDSGLKQNFIRLSLIFDFIWYGDFPIGEIEFKSIKQEFDSMLEKLA